MAPGTTASLRRSLPITWSALIFRSASGFRVTNMRPWFAEVLPPAKPTMVSTAGSFITMPTNCVILSFMEANEISCAA